MERGYRSNGSSMGSSREMEDEEMNGQPAAAEEERVHVAVPGEFKAGKSTLVWAVQNLPKDAKVVLLHVHVPAQMIPTMGTKFHYSRLKEQEVRAYRHLEREKLESNLNHYIKACAQLKVTVEKLVIERDNIVNGIIELISFHGITKLVMGAAADKQYSRRMKTPKSAKATEIMEKADPSCKIWFVCKGALICTREASGITSANPPSPAPSSGSGSLASLSDRLTGFFLPAGDHPHDLLSRSPPRHLSNPHSLSHQPTRPNPNPALTNPALTRAGMTACKLRVEGAGDPWEGISRRRFSQSSEHSVWTVNDDLASVAESRDDVSEVGSVVRRDDGDDEELGMDTDMFEKYKEALNEAEVAKREAYEESNKRRRAERELLSALQKARETDALYQNELRQRQGNEETLNVIKQENEQLKAQMDTIYIQLQNVSEAKHLNEQRIVELEHARKDAEDRLSATRYLMQSLESSNEDLKHQLDNATHEASELKKKSTLQRVVSKTHEGLSNEFSRAELDEATGGFGESAKIGEGGFGSVYRGVLRNTTVAVKILHQDGMQGTSEFHQEIAVLSKIRHPNLVTLIGSCPESYGLVYEYLPNGSLEDRLACANNTPPLTWQARTRIIGEICSALIFLHSSRPHPVIHGDLKPDNILLDANLVSKLSDFGICRMLVLSNSTSTSLYRTTNPKGTLAYMDPEFISTGEVTPKSDVYSFGIIILRLLTGRQPLNISNIVERAIENGDLHKVVDKTAGEWPFVQASQLAHVGLKCTELSRRKRADLKGDVWRVIEPMVKTASLSVRSLERMSVLDENRVPSYFLCPISQEIMRDPHIAADGYTYEGKEIKKWLDGGHDTSPMTNLRLDHFELVPNRALRSTILEFFPQFLPSP
ncbi:hypothetical protein LUZ60_016757 [Juncus effusus]|nr:hypothetical protein LUZ60_016757 [Juncus effusus]